MSGAVTIDVHSICWNEERMLPLFLSHYSGFAARIVVWDNYSDDASQDLVRACPRAELRLYDSGGRSSEDSFLEVKNQCWPSSDADWVIVCDIDELVYHPVEDQIGRYGLLAARQSPQDVSAGWAGGVDCCGP